jgi:hypothetical protein
MMLLILVPLIFAVAALSLILAALVHVILVKSTPGKEFDADEMAAIAVGICAVFSLIIGAQIF